MQVDEALVKRVANLARIDVRDDELAPLVSEFSSLLTFLEELNEVDVEGVEPLTSVTPMNAPMREDIVNDGEKAADVLKNAPLAKEGFFAVPKVVE